jgi:hypothetical protein
MRTRYINSLRDRALTTKIQALKPGVVVVNAPRPIAGDETWQGEFVTGSFYATGSLEEYGKKWERLGAVQLILITNAEVFQKVIVGCQSHPLRHGLRALLEKRGKQAMQEMAANLELHYMIDESSDFAAELDAADWSVLGTQK